MLPSEWRLVETIPRQPSGKINRRGLHPDLGKAVGRIAADPQLDRNTQKSGVPDPINDQEAIILDALKQIAPHTPQDPKLGFFELGITSLQLITLRRSLEKKLDQTLPLAIFFEHQSPAQLASYIFASKQGKKPPAQKMANGLNMQERQKLKRQNQNRRSRQHRQRRLG